MQFELTKEFINQIIHALEIEDSEFIVKAIHPLHPADIAEVLEIIDLHQAQLLFRLLDETLAAEVLVEIEEDRVPAFLLAMCCLTYDLFEDHKSMNNLTPWDPARIQIELAVRSYSKKLAEKHNFISLES